MLKVEPARLDLGRVFTKKTATGAVRLINAGAEPLTIEECKVDCRCATADCPRGRELRPGEGADVSIRLTAGALPRTMHKSVTFKAVGQSPVMVPISAQVVAFVMIDPVVIDPDQATDGRVVLEATDGQPFRITAMVPPVIKEFSPEARLRHELFLDWDAWRELGQARRLVFNVDHPEQSSTAISVRAGSARRPGR
jgi:hypothetical protein